MNSWRCNNDDLIISKFLRWEVVSIVVDLISGSALQCLGPSQNDRNQNVYIFIYFVFHFLLTIWMSSPRCNWPSFVKWSAISILCKIFLCCLSTSFHSVCVKQFLHFLISPNSFVFVPLIWSMSLNVHGTCLILCYIRFRWFALIITKMYIRYCNKPVFVYLTLTLLVTLHKHLHYNLISTKRFVSNSVAWIFLPTSIKKSGCEVGTEIMSFQFKSTLHPCSSLWGNVTQDGTLVEHI